MLSKGRVSSHKALTRQIVTHRNIGAPFNGRITRQNRDSVPNKPDIVQDGEYVHCSWLLHQRHTVCWVNNNPNVFLRCHQESGREETHRCHCAKKYVNVLERAKHRTISVYNVSIPDLFSVEYRKDTKARKEKEIQAKALTAMSGTVRPWTLKTS